MLDEFCAVDGRNQQFCRMISGTLSGVDRALEFSFEDRSIDLPQFPGRSLIFYSNHDTVRVKEIAYGRALSQELGI